jgi:hypothetical protein
MGGVGCSCVSVKSASGFFRCDLKDINPARFFESPHFESVRLGVLLSFLMIGTHKIQIKNSTTNRAQKHPKKLRKAPKCSLTTKPSQIALSQTRRIGVLVVPLLDPDSVFTQPLTYLLKQLLCGQRS